MMDLKEIIKWFIPCFHILRVKTDARWTCICLFLLLNFCGGLTANIENLDVSERNETKNVDLSKFYDGKSEQSDILNFIENRITYDTSSNGRTFGLRFKKLAQALIPLVFQIGAASTWAVVAAIVGIKTLVVALIILKLLLIAGAAKIGALFSSKLHHTGGWEASHPHQKEIHLHIHNGYHSSVDDDHSASVWNRDGSAMVQDNVGNTDAMFNPYSGGPQTISTPYGNYIKMEPKKT